MIAVQELDCEQWWLSQVIVRDDSRSGGRTTRCFEEVGPDFTLRIIDPRLTTENLDLLPGVPITDPKNDSKTEWATKQEHGGLPYWRPVFLGHSQSYIRAPASTATSSMEASVAPGPAQGGLYVNDDDDDDDAGRDWFIDFVTGMFEEDESRITKDQCARVLCWHVQGRRGRATLDHQLERLRPTDAIYYDVESDEIVLREREQQVLMEQADPQSVASHADAARGGSYPPYLDKPISVNNPKWAPPALGCDATGFFDNAHFMCAWIFMQERGNVADRQDVCAWVWRCVTGHGPDADLKLLVDFEEMTQAVQHRMGVPMEQWFWLLHVTRMPADNENNNTGRFQGLAAKLNRHRLRQWRFLTKHRLFDGPFEYLQLIGCGLHILNLGDVYGAAEWRQQTNDPYTPDTDPVIGGLNKSESWVHFVCRFFSKTMRNNVPWRAFLARMHEDYAMCPRALNARFWSRLRTGEYLYDRFEYCFDEFFNGEREALEKSKKSAPYILLTEMKHHRRMLLEDLEVTRVMQLWAHGPIGHSASSRHVEAKDHTRSLKAFVAQAGVMGGVDCSNKEVGTRVLDNEEEATEECARVFQKYLPIAQVQKAEFRAECEARVQDEADAAAYAEQHGGQRLCNDDGSTPGSRKKQRLRERTHTHDARVDEAQAAMSRVPTEHQERRTKAYAAGMHIKHWQFARNVLDETVGEDPEAKFHTFDIERR